ncbi:MAG: FtsW/RodA/SpoVE family cell cycle protein [Lachnospiraceae bacterium]|nr:FtsW/RodA/SpoVE family cell cycle protein [Lachnospiraceae bacterium]
MKVIFLTFNKYIELVLMAVYTIQCFSVFRYSDEKDRNGIYIRQDVGMALIYFLSFLQLYLQMMDINVIRFYIITQLLFLCVILLFRLLYPKANKLLVNNMCMLISIGFTILVRLNFQKAKKQFVVVLISFVLAFVIPLILKTFNRLRRFYPLFAFTGIAALSAVLFFSSAINGSKLNIKIGGVSFQASEFVKIIFVFAIAGILTCVRSNKRILISCIVAGLHVLLLVASKDLGSAVIFYIVYIVMLFIATGRMRYFWGGLMGAGLFSVVGYFMFSHVRVRVEAFMDPLGTIDNSGYQIAQSLFAIGTGGFTGMGLYMGVPNRIPVVEADFIFAAISEEFGVLFGICMVLICVSCFVMFMNIAMRFNDMFYKLVAVGLAVTYGFQVFLTIGGVTKFIPLTGVTLPLVSYGSNSIMVSLIMFSVIQGLYVSVKSMNDEDNKKKAKD